MLPWVALHKTQKKSNIILHGAKQGTALMLTLVIKFIFLEAVVVGGALREYS